jgi:hypothetical protein
VDVRDQSYVVRITCPTRSGLLFDIVAALKQLGLEVRESAPLVRHFEWRQNALCVLILPSSEGGLLMGFADALHSRGLKTRAIMNYGSFAYRPTSSLLHSKVDDLGFRLDDTNSKEACSNELPSQQPFS